MGPRIFTTERTVMTIWDALSNVGGLMGFVFGFLSIIASQYNEISFYFSLGSELFTMKVD